MRFGVANYLSIREYQELSFVASSLKDSGADLIDMMTIKETLLPVVLIYGANASGKSNILAALRFFRTIILTSQTQSLPSGNIPRHYFRLDSNCAKQPTVIDCDFMVSGIRYHYGFKATNDSFLEEWLYAYPQGKRQLWFTRDGKFVRPGKFLRGQNKLIEAIMRPNSLFLSAAAQSNHEQLSPIYQFFESSIASIISQDYPYSILNNMLSDNSDYRDRIVAFLKRADTGINSLKFKDVELPAATKRFSDRIFKLVSEEFLDAKLPNMFSNKEISLGHTTRTGDNVYFDLQAESRGTIRLLSLLSPILDVLDRGGLIAIDEIDSSLHTLLAKDIISLFTSRETNRHGAQLVSTTHDTNLLCSPDVRRDQIWFTEKDKGGATHLYPLTDIRTRNTDNLEKGYLQGRFGAVPFLGSTKRLLAEGDK